MLKKVKICNVCGKLIPKGTNYITDGNEEFYWHMVCYSENKRKIDVLHPVSIFVEKI